MKALTGGLAVFRVAEAIVKGASLDLDGLTALLLGVERRSYPPPA
jgi:hypothetical protein